MKKVRRNGKLNLSDLNKIIKRVNEVIAFF